MTTPDVVGCYCTHCDSFLQGPKHAVGKLIKCPICGEKTKVVPEPFRKQIPVEKIKGGKISAVWILLTLPLACVFWFLIYVPSLTWINKKANPAKYDNELAEQLEAIDVKIQRAKVKAEKYPAFVGETHTCFLCRKRPIDNYRRYNDWEKAISLGFCSSCVEPKSVGKYAKQPLSTAYEKYKAKKKSFDAEKLAPLLEPIKNEQEQIMKPYGGKKALFWYIPLICWAVIGCTLAFVIAFFPAMNSDEAQT